MSENNKSVQLLRSGEIYSSLEDAKTSLEALVGQRKDGEVLAARYYDGGDVKTILGTYHNIDGGSAGVTVMSGGEGENGTLDVEANGTSPLNLSAEMQDGKLILTGSVDDATEETAGVVKPVSVLTEDVEINEATSEEGRYYPVQTTPDNQLVVNVPWVDNTEKKVLTIGDNKAMDVVFYDSVNDNAVAVSPDDVNADDYPADRYTPIGIVVVPSSWDIYGDGTCGIMALPEMNYSTPDTGSATSHQAIYWGQHNVNTALKNYNVCVQTGTTASPTSEASGTNENCYMPSDDFSGTACPTDSSAYYYYSSSAYRAAPSPFLDDGSLNPVYIQTESPSTEYNCLSDFDGKGNTEVLCDLATAQTDWKTDSTITNNSGSGYSPAACCCWRFHTAGTNQGDWYLPAEGELGCIIARMKAINNTIDKLNSAYGAVALTFTTTYYYWSSSEYSSTHARYLYTNGSVACSEYKNNSYFHVRAFARLATTSATSTTPTFNVEANGTSPLNLSAEMTDGNLVITGSVDDATATTAGVVKPVSVLSESVTINEASSDVGRYYPIQTDPDNRMVVNVPWMDFSEEKELLQKIYDYLKEQMEGGDEGGETGGETGGGSLANANVMNVVFYDSEQDKVIAVESDDINADDYPIDRYTPIGIVVVPSSWDIYGDGTCGVMSLSAMNYDTPDEGSNTTYQVMYWGQYNVDTSLKNYDVAVKVGTTISPTAEASGTDKNCYIPSDAFSGTACPTDSQAYYYASPNSNSAAPSPFLDDGSLNPVYIQTESPSTEYNCLSDFDGKGNTEVLCDLATAQSDWKTDSTITNNSDSGYSPAACCCWRFSTPGTNQGDWYLPAMGELGCAIARMSAINDTISKLNEIYGTVGLSLGTNNVYWSSSEVSSTQAMEISSNNNCTYYIAKNGSYAYARAFARF